MKQSEKEGLTRREIIGAIGSIVGRMRRFKQFDTHPDTFGHW